MKHYDMKIGAFFRFDYVSTSPAKVAKNPIKISLSDARRMEIIAGVQAKAAAGEKRFADLRAATDAPGGLSDMQLKLAAFVKAQDEEKAARKLARRPNKTAEHVELETAMKAEWQRLIGSGRDGSTMTTGEQFFYRQYKAEALTLSDTGSIYGCLVSKSITQSGEVIFTFLRMSPVTAEAETVEALEAAEREKVVVVG